MTRYAEAHRPRCFLQRIRRSKKQRELHPKSYELANWKWSLLSIKTAVNS